MKCKFQLLGLFTGLYMSLGWVAMFAVEGKSVVGDTFWSVTCLCTPLVLAYFGSVFDRYHES